MPSNPTRATRVACRTARALLAPTRAVNARIVARLDTQDEAARARGWTVTPTLAAGRSYRDPRFDRLASRTAGLAAETQEVRS